MAKRGVRFFNLWAKRFRLVTHYGVSADDVELALEEFKKELE
jgi:hypothetical protein